MVLFYLPGKLPDVAIIEYFDSISFYLHDLLLTLIILISTKWFSFNVFIANIKQYVRSQVFFPTFTAVTLMIKQIYPTKLQIFGQLNN